MITEITVMENCRTITQEEIKESIKKHCEELLHLVEVNDLIDFDLTSKIEM